MAKVVAFFGLGHMGAPMSFNLVKAGFQVKGYDPVAKLLNSAISQGVEKCVSPHQAVEGADFVVSMLPMIEPLNHCILMRKNYWRKFPQMP